ncbi:hypothetical protein CMI43_03220 [Candidatus Pacearchaeota archaeon]|nr:hypothetical protein [Candidatus Pacearchaeota archaeon]
MPKQDKDNVEIIITTFLLISLIFLAINFNLQLGTIFSTMILTSVFLYFALPATITHNTKPKNTFNAVIIAAFSLAILLIITFFVSSAFQGILNVTAQPTLGSILSSGFSTLGIDKVVQSTEPVLAKNPLITLFAFGVIIATIETRFLARIAEALGKFTNIDITKINIKSIALFVLVSLIFVWYHFNAKGVNANVALFLTFIFAMISLILISRFKEIESATYLHVFNNTLFILPQIQGG